MSPQSSPIADLSVAPAPAGTVTQLDCTNSKAPTGNLRRWSLDFGDGSPILTDQLGPPIVVLHVYTSPGSYAATLTVYDNRGNSAVERVVFEVPAALPEPEPVDCVMSEWALTEAGPWAPCVDGQRSRVMVYDRTVLVPPSDGGAACGDTRKTETETEACVVEPEPPPDGTGHAYFDALKTRAERAFTLRDNAQLALYCQTWPDKVTRDFNYVFPNDPDPRKQDAAKLVIPSDGSGGGSGGPYPVNPLNRNSIYQMRLPMPTMQPGTPYLVIWDAWFGHEWRNPISGIDGHKAYQFDGPDRPGGAAKIWWEPNYGYRGNAKYPVDDATVAHARARHYASSIKQASSGVWFGVPTGPNITTKNSSLTPCEPHAPFFIKPQTWVRTWQLIEYGMDTLTIKDYAAGTVFPPEWEALNMKGTLMSMWMADEEQDPVKVYDRAQVTLWNPGVRQFWLEFNTSLNEVKVGRPPLVGYFRNVLMFDDVGHAGVAPLLVKPVR